MGMHYGVRGRVLPTSALPLGPGSLPSDPALGRHASSGGLTLLPDACGPTSHSDAMSRHGSVTGPLQLPPQVCPGECRLMAAQPLHWLF